MSAIAGRRIGRTPLHVSTLGLGGAPLADFAERVGNERASATLTAAYEAGVRYFDTAPLYGHGLSEHRVGHVLRDLPRDTFVLSTKVGRWLRPVAPERVDRGLFVGGLNFQPVFDYSYDGTMRALEQSYARLGMEKIDIALIHDVDVWTHGSAEAYEVRFREAMEGAYRALDDLRRQGVIGAIGVGVNEVAPCVRFAGAGDFDCMMLAGRYTLLEQQGLADLFPLARQKDISLLIAGPFNSGILATGAIDAAKYDYRLADDGVRKRVRELQAICSRHAVPLGAAALQFVLANPAVASVVPGAVSPQELHQNAGFMRHPIPPGFWVELRASGLLHRDAPVPPADA